MRKLTVPAGTTAASAWTSKSLSSTFTGVPLGVGSCRRATVRGTASASAASTSASAHAQRRPARVHAIPSTSSRWPGCSPALPARLRDVERIPSGGQGGEQRQRQQEDRDELLVNAEVVQHSSHPGGHYGGHPGPSGEGAQEGRAGA